ncbi:MULTISPECIES: hypothetical protein [unclassified Exiguobacterium]|uniref:hypothetical protein n=1 Tax=unclassified Exiguobacterium TaxID=2644629 RepID=UPI001BED2909|nr:MULTISPECIES: hypothetical protein [unclassified Exiguobacterium]
MTPFEEQETVEEVIEFDTQASEHWGLEQEQALMRDIDRRKNVFYPTKGERETIKHD